MMIKYILLFVLSFSALVATAQNKEVNPNVDTEWRFIRTQDLNMQSGSFYNFEFPADNRYDYIFNLTHNKNKVFATISIFDLQDQLVKKIVLEENTLSVDLNFDVPQSGTYNVVIGVTDPKGKKGEIIPSQFVLVRRIKM